MRLVGWTIIDATRTVSSNPALVSSAGWHGKLRKSTYAKLRDPTSSEVSQLTMSSTFVSHTAHDMDPSLKSVPGQILGYHPYVLHT